MGGSQSAWTNGPVHVMQATIVSRIYKHPMESINAWNTGYVDAHAWTRDLDEELPDGGARMAPGMTAAATWDDRGARQNTNTVTTKSLDRGVSYEDHLCRSIIVCT